MSYDVIPFLPPPKNPGCGAEDKGHICKSGPEKWLGRSKQYIEEPRSKEIWQVRGKTSTIWLE